MKLIGSLLMIALLVITNGCATSATVKRAKGYTDERVQPLTGDTVFLHGGHSYVIQQTHVEGENPQEMPPPMLQRFPPPYYAFSPSPGCYALLPVTVPFDIITSPFQAVGLGLLYCFIHNYHE